MTLKLEVGKRYIRRDGVISGVIEKGTSETHPFCDPNIDTTYTEDGIWHGDTVTESDVDLIAEHTENTPTQSLPPENKAATDKVNTGLTMIPYHSVIQLGSIFVEGLRYGKDNWKKGVNDPEYQEERLEHALRHLFLWKEGDRTESHLAKVMWFCATQLELERLQNESPS